MKKFMSLLLCLVVIFSFNVPSFALEKAEMENASMFEATVKLNNQLIPVKDLSGDGTIVNDGEKLVRIKCDNPNIVEITETNYVLANGETPEKVAEFSGDFEIETIDITDLEEKSIDPVTITPKNWDATRTQQGWDSSSIVKGVLKVYYEYQTEYDANFPPLHLCRAQGTFSGSESGVAGRSFDIFYRALGKVYHNGVFQHGNGLSGSYSGYSSGSIVNLMGNGMGVYGITAGVTMTVNCTRGVSFDITMNWNK